MPKNPNGKPKPAVKQEKKKVTRGGKRIGKATKNTSNRKKDFLC